jgi:hypothetical protein
MGMGRRSDDLHTTSMPAPATCREPSQERFSVHNRSIELRDTTALRIGVPADEIVRSVSDRDIDLIVMGTHGRSAMAHMLMGSVAEVRLTLIAKACEHRAHIEPARSQCTRI